VPDRRHLGRGAGRRDDRRPRRKRASMTEHMTSSPTDTAPATGTTDASGDDGSPGLVRRILRGNTVWTLAILVVLVAFFTIAAPDTFLTQYDVTQIATNAAIYLVLGVGATYVIITGGIDLSIGSVLVLSGVLAAEYNTHHGGYRAGWSVIIVAILISV